MIRKFVAAWVVMTVFWAHGGISAQAGQSDSPDEIVSNFQAGLVEVMKVSEQLTPMQRFEKLAPVVDKAFHLPLMTQIAVGSYWGRASDENRQEVVRAFRRMSLSTLATLFDGYGGEVFEHQRNKPGPSKTLIVVTDLVKSDNSRVQIAYVMREFRSGWRIIDVVIDGGISELKVRRSEYRMTLKEAGIPGLIQLLDTKADQLMSGSEIN